MKQCVYMYSLNLDALFARAPLLLLLVSLAAQLDHHVTQLGEARLDLRAQLTRRLLGLRLCLALLAHRLDLIDRQTDRVGYGSNIWTRACRLYSVRVPYITTTGNCRDESMY